jgi:hypothetical protein
MIVMQKFSTGIIFLAIGSMVTYLIILAATSSPYRCGLPPFKAKTYLPASRIVCLKCHEEHQIDLPTHLKGSKP